MVLSNRIKVFIEHPPGCFDQNLREAVIKKKKKKTLKNNSLFLPFSQRENIIVVKQL